MGASLRRGSVRVRRDCLESGAIVAFSRNSDPFAHLVSFSMTIAYVAGIFARNFGNIRFVIVQALCAWVPMTAALLLYGNPFDWIFAGLSHPALSWR